MNKAGKHIQMPTTGNSNFFVPSSGSSSLLTSPQSQQKNVISSIMSFLPDNRPITSLQIVEDYQRCPKNFTTVHRTYDQDADADLWRESIIFGRQPTRYLCLSKTEGLPEYVVETLKVIAEKVQPPKEFSLLSRTADTEQKAWRKRQIAYKLSKRGTVTHAVTDIILCSKLKIAPEGFKLAGDINGILVCYKMGSIPVRLPPPVPQLSNSNGNNSSGVNQQSSEIEKALNRLNLSGSSNSNNWNPKQPLPPVPAAEHDYEEIVTSLQINSPQRLAPRQPPCTVAAATSTSGHSVGTLGAYSELDGVPFVINAALMPANRTAPPTLPQTSAPLNDLDYDFQLERQILCTMKSSASKNPFFK